MADQTARQRARRTALDAQARMRARRVEQERRRDALGVVVVSALAERDAVVSACEARAGAARLRHAAQTAAVAGPVRGARTASADAGADGAGGAVAGDGGSGGGRAIG